MKSRSNPFVVHQPGFFAFKDATDEAVPTKDDMKVLSVDWWRATPMELNRSALLGMLTQEEMEEIEEASRVLQEEPPMGVKHLELEALGAGPGLLRALSLEGFVETLWSLNKVALEERIRPMLNWLREHAEAEVEDAKDQAQEYLMGDFLENRSTQAQMVEDLREMLSHERGIIVEDEELECLLDDRKYEFLHTRLLGHGQDAPHVLHYEGIDPVRGQCDGADYDERLEPLVALLKGADWEEIVQRAKTLKGSHVDGIFFEDFQEDFDGSFDIRVRTGLSVALCVDLDVLVKIVQTDRSDEPALKVRAFGKETRLIQKLRKPDAVLTPAGFKRQHPVEFAALLPYLPSGHLSPDMLPALEQRFQTPFEWVVTKRRYSSMAQRTCPGPNDAFLFNIDVSVLEDSDLSRGLKKLHSVIERGGHLYEGLPLLTIGWVRFCKSTEVWLIEEIQSDIDFVRFAHVPDDPERGHQAWKQMVHAGLQDYEIDLVQRALAPLRERFFEDALSYVFLQAEEAGAEVEMLDYKSKEVYGSPSFNYTTLPRSMGMRLKDTSRIVLSPPDKNKVWRYRSNARPLEPQVKPKDWVVLVYDFDGPRLTPRGPRMRIRDVRFDSAWETQEEAMKRAYALRRPGKRGTALAHHWKLAKKELEGFKKGRSKR